MQRQSYSTGWAQTFQKRALAGIEGTTSSQSTTIGWACTGQLCLNPIMKEEYFKILKEVRETYNIPDELVYGADETGIQSGIGMTERVIRPAGAKMQHQQCSGR
jgi:hypothetical protein